MAAKLPYEEISPWVETPAELRDPLAEDLRTDVVVIGGGYTGLSTAIDRRTDRQIRALRG